MCGRFALEIPYEALADAFQIAEPKDVPPRYNIAPTQQVAAIRQYSDRTNHLDFLHWGLIPSWSRDRAPGCKMINARSETVGEKPAFKQSVRYRRCVVVASGFYEWLAVGKSKQPMYTRLKGNGVMAFAGLWDSWKSPEGEVVDSCTILTTASNPLIEPVHERMPVLCEDRNYV